MFGSQQRATLAPATRFVRTPLWMAPDCDLATDRLGMNSFARAVFLSLQHRWTLLGAILSSVFVGLLWSANLGTVYPIVEVVFRGKSLHEWIDEELEATEVAMTQMQATLTALEAELPRATGARKSALQRQIGFEKSRLEAERVAHQQSLKLQPYIDRWLPKDPFRTLLAVVAVVLVLTVLKDMALTGNMLLVERLTQHTVYDLRTQIYRKTLDMDLAAFQQDGASGLMSRMTHDIAAMSYGIRALWGKCVREPLKMVACLVGAAMICWRLLVLTLLVAPLAIFVVRLISRSLKRANRRAMEEMQSLYAVLAESFGGIQVVKAYTMERYERRRVRETSKQLYRKSMRIALYTALTRPATEMLGISIICLAMVAGGYLVLTQETHLLGIRMCERPLSLGAMAAFYALVIGVSDPARKLGDVMGFLQTAAAAAERVFPLLDQRPKVVETETPRPLPKPHGELVFDRVTFHYQPGEPVLQDFSLRVPFGEKLAIVGPNGCGKSTLTHLICRFYDPVEGTVRLDDVNLREARLRELRRKIGIVTQQTVLFNDTILNNIRYGTPHASEEEVIAAAKKAHAHRFIVEKLEDGYQTVVGEGGGRLSGGQRQRISLARAILRDPEILILDEATSQIDMESEQLIHQALKEFAQDRTTIMITHRISTLNLADRVLVMEAGRIVDLGAHRELIGRCEVYRRLHQLQLRESA